MTFFLKKVFLWQKYFFLKRLFAADNQHATFNTVIYNSQADFIGLHIFKQNMIVPSKIKKRKKCDR